MKKYIVAGAALDTGNLGVSALCYSTLEQVYRNKPDAEVTVLDNSLGLRTRDVEFTSGVHKIAMLGCAWSKRFHRSNNLPRALFCSRFPFIRSLILDHFNRADVVLDISGGDSFTDLYGQKRFNLVAATKQIAVRMKKELVLLPQTYGPFKSDRNFEAAAKLVEKSRIAWARDENSFEILKKLAGDTQAQGRVKCGVDVAFMLPKLTPPSSLIEAVQPWLNSTSIRVGFNVSGLIWNDQAAAREKYSFKADYRTTVVNLLRWLVDIHGVDVLLVPHVNAPQGNHESDSQANFEVCKAVDRPQSVRIAPEVQDPRHAKWIISQADWFCGTRMHATIAGLSSGVPTATICYSDKAAGVFDSCQQCYHVADPRFATTENVVALIQRSFEIRDTARQSLASALPSVLTKAQEQLADL